VPDPPRSYDRHDEYIGSFTADGSPPPDPYAFFTVQESRVSSPRYVRLTSASVGIDSGVQQNSGVPIAAVIQPLAEEGPGEEPVPLAETTNAGPLRCRNCMAYVNPFFAFIDGGRRFVCNLCGETCDVGEAGAHYIGDRSTRPELTLGTYEFLAPKDYSNKPIPDPTYLICIESTISSASTGLYSQVLNSLKMILDYIPYAERARVGIVTYDNSLRFYKLSGSTSDIREVILNNLDDPFAPEPINGFTYPIVEYREALDGLIDALLEKEVTATTAVSIYSVIATLK
jgi:protein transport protein SEC24